MKRLLFSAMFAILGATLTLTGASQGSQADPDRNVQGGGLPAGWQARLDSSYARINSLKFVPMGTGLHATTGPSGILFKPEMKATGPYEVRATFTQAEPSAHPEAYGLFIGGSDLNGPNQKYTYFLIEQTGEYIIKRRNGTSTPTIIDWTANPSVKKGDASGKAVNTLAINVGKDAVQFLVNGTQVASRPVAQVDTNGIVGLRINHNLSVHIEGFAVKQ